MGENPSNQVSDTIGSDVLKDITNVLKKSTVGTGETTDSQINNSIGNSEIGTVGNLDYIGGTTDSKVNNSTGSNGTSNSKYDSFNLNSETENAGYIGGTTFKIANTNLPEKTGVWTKIKNALFYEIKVELTPYQQKVEDEINEFLHQEITWGKVKDFLCQEVVITYKGKRIF